jgi:hypothetical protein
MSERSERIIQHSVSGASCELSLDGVSPMGELA